MSATIDVQDLSRFILVDLLRDGLRGTAAWSVNPPTDPRAASRPAESQFVLTSFPDRDVFYPLIVLGEANDQGERLDHTFLLEEHNFDVSVDIHAETDTHLFQIRDQVRGWVSLNHDALSRRGFVQPQVVSSGRKAWGDVGKVKEWGMTIGGTPYVAEV